MAIGGRPCVYSDQGRLIPAGDNNKKIIPPFQFHFSPYLVSQFFQQPHMRSTITRLSSIALLLLAAAGPAQAQFEKFPGFIKNYEIGYGYSKTWGTYERRDKAVSAETGKVYDTTLKMNVSSKFGFSAQTGTIIPIKQLGKSSKLALGLVFLYQAYTWDYPTANGAFLSDSGYIRYDYTGGLSFSSVTLNAGAAISADFKFGADAMMDKRYRWCWTGGIGVMPSIGVTSDFDNADIQYNVQPFLKTEVGLRAGIVWKLRLMYQFLPIHYLDVSPNSGFFPGSQQTVRLTGNGNFTASLVLMPFSWMYKRSMWYNTPQ